MPNRVPVPYGFRELKPGETVREGDIYFSTNGRWSPVPIVGVKISDNGVQWATPVMAGSEFEEEEKVQQ